MSDRDRQTDGQNRHRSTAHTMLIHCIAQDGETWSRSYCGMTLKRLQHGGRITLLGNMIIGELPEIF